MLLRCGASMRPPCQRRIRVLEIPIAVCRSCLTRFLRHCVTIDAMSRATKPWLRWSIHREISSDVPASRFLPEGSLAPLFCWALEHKTLAHSSSWRAIQGRREFADGAGVGCRQDFQIDEVSLVFRDARQQTQHLSRRRSEDFLRLPRIQFFFGVGFVMPLWCSTVR